MTARSAFGNAFCSGWKEGRGINKATVRDNIANPSAPCTEMGHEHEVRDRESGKPREEVNTDGIKRRGRSNTADVRPW